MAASASRRRVRGVADMAGAVASRSADSVAAAVLVVIIAADPKRGLTAYAECLLSTEIRHSARTFRPLSAYLLTCGTAITATLPADIDGFSRYRAPSIHNAS